MAMGHKAMIRFLLGVLTFCIFDAFLHQPSIIDEFNLEQVTESWVLIARTTFSQ
jgi:hypothetical protein